jgi:ubiquinone/menaquinone biosynthesis C-methylase UbiE
LYNKYPHLELPFLEATIPKSKKEVEGICRILKKYKIGTGARILDFSCGIGCHSMELAQKDFKVVGYDPSKFYIDYARRWSKKQDPKTKQNVRFVQGDPIKLIGNLSIDEKFEAAIVMGATIGINNEKFDTLILENIRKVLNIGSILILEIENRDWTVNNFQSHIHHQSESIEVIEEWKLNLESSESQSITKFYQKIRNDHNYLELILKLKIKLRLYSLHEIIKMLRIAGWYYSESYDSIDNLTPVKNQCRDMIVVATNGI